MTALLELIERAKKARPSLGNDRFDLLLSDKRKETRSVYNCQVRKFLKYRPKLAYDKWDVLDYIKYLKASGYSSSYIRGTYYALKLFFEASGWPWDLKLPKIEETTSFKPTLSEEEIIGLIRSIKIEGTAEEKAYLALSTTYGLRRCEMAQLTNDDFDWQEKTIFVRTRKGGNPRKHLIPDSILLILNRHDFGRVLSTSYLSLLWKTISLKGGLKLENGLGWHGVRHALNTALIERGVHHLKISEFLRWKYEKKRSMVAYYYSPNQRELDLEIFELHPFLKPWEA